jgi:hypothetical protein
MTSLKSIGCWPSEETLMMRAVGARLARRVTSTRADARIVDENVNSAKGITDLSGEAADFRKRRQIGAVERCCAAAGGPNAIDQALPSILTAPMDNNVGTRLGELLGDDTTDAIGRSGNQDGPTLKLHCDFSSGASPRPTRPETPRSTPAAPERVQRRPLLLDPRHQRLRRGEFYAKRVPIIEATMKARLPGDV